VEGLYELRPADLLDVGMVALLLWLAIVGLRRSGATLALVGLGVLGAVYVAALRFDWQLTSWMLRGFFAVFVVVVVVVFQDDLRRLFEQIAVWGLRRGPPASPASSADVLVRSVTRLAARRIGALIVIPGREPLDRHLEGGIPLAARLSEPLILSLLEPHSPGHDGAVLVSGDRVPRFAVHLPLSDDRHQLGPGGTRHAAALGLAEVTDALCIAVSEERGSVSVARDGRIRVLEKPGALTEELRRFAAETIPATAPRAVLGMAARWPEALVAVVFASAMWLIFVAGASVIEVERTAEVVVEHLPESYALESVEPAAVTVVVEGSRRRLYLEDLDDVRVRLDALLVQLGRRTFTVSPAQVDHPDGLRILDVQPSRVRISVRRVAAPAVGSPPAERESGS
jgi:uncharacterized protein (TIGR00159 family)